MNKITISKLEQLDFSAQARIYDTTEIHLGVYYARISQGWRKNRREIEITIGETEETVQLISQVIAPPQKGRKLR